MVATRSGAGPELVELLLNHGAPIDAPTESGVTLLHIAVLYGRSDIVTLLLLRSADVNAIAAQGTLDPLDTESRAFQPPS
jgi:ankyrin repeat protein